MRDHHATFWVMAGVGLVLIAAVFHVGFYDRLTQRRYSVLELRNDCQELYQEYARVQADYEVLTSPRRISELSSTLLSLKQTANLEILPSEQRLPQPRVVRFAQRTAPDEGL